MKLVIMGTGPFAVPSAQRLLDDGHEISLVVTRPLIGKSKKPPPRPVYDWACERKLPLFEPESINSDEAIARLKEEQADLFFVCDYGQILSRECLGASRLGGINLHGSLLPRHRGAAPVQWALLRGDSDSGVTVIHMTPRLDAGPALEIASSEILPDETAAELEPRLAELGVQATAKAVEKLAGWDEQTPIGTIQDKALVTKAPRFAKQHGQLDFRLPADYLVRLVRACQPWPGTFAELRWPSGKQVRLIVRKARTVPFESLTPKPGTAVALETADLSHAQQSTAQDWPAPWDQALAVHCSSGLFLIGSLQPAGKREMSAREFLRGHPLEEGCEFILPNEPLSPLDQA